MTIMKAEMPATVWQVKVAVGDEVGVGEELVILESMKMEIPVCSPVAGTVSALHVAPNDSVEEGQHLVELT